MIKYTLIRKANKRMYLRIKNGQVVVTAPRNVPKSEIDAFVNKNSKWIETHLNEPKKGLVEGDMVHLFDRDIRIHFKNTVPKLENDCLFLPKDQQMLEMFVYEYSHQTINNRLIYYASKMAPQTKLKLKLNYYKSKWGSCKPTEGLIALNLNLAYTDLECIDAVIVHELAHLYVSNHSSEFYRIVESVLPDYRQRMKNLKQYPIPFINS